MTLMKKLALLGTSIALTTAMAATAQAKPSAKSQQVFDHWTAERIADAQPRDMVIDHRGLGYVKGKNGQLTPHGHTKRPELTMKKTKGIVPMAKPPSNGDSTPPTVVTRSPADGATISTTPTFSAVVTDASGVKSVVFNIDYGGQVYNFDATNVGNDTWEASLSGFTSGSGTWTVTATDTTKRGGNSSTTGSFGFSVDGTPPPPPSGDVVTNSRWDKGGDIQTSTGRLFYEMISARRGKRYTWSGYVCSGTVTNDAATGRSVIITAAHCVYNDEYKAFARNVLFIPNQDQTTGSGTDSDCTNDPLGCWTADFGVVEENWTTRTFPSNIPWDYAYYVVDDSGSHSGNGSSGSLETVAGGFDVSFATPNHDDGNSGPGSLDWTHNLGYSYSDDPFFMYSAMDMEEMDAANWWQPQSDLSGGSSGGPWIQPMNEASGNGPIISVNSWGYTNGDPGMAGPKLSGTTAQCAFDAARTAPMSTGNNADGEQGVVVDPSGC